MSGTAPDRLVDPHEPEWVTGAKRAWATVFLRDWHPTLRDPLDLSA